MTSTQKKLQLLSLSELQQVIKRGEDAGVLDLQTPKPRTKNDKIKFIVDAIKPPSKKKNSRDSKSKWLKSAEAVRVISLIIGSIFLFKVSLAKSHDKRHDNATSEPTRASQEKFKQEENERQQRIIKAITQKSKLKMQIQNYEKNQSWFQWVLKKIANQSSSDLTELNNYYQEALDEIRRIQKERTNSKKSSFKSWQQHPDNEKIKKIMQKTFNKFSKNEKMRELDFLEKKLVCCSWYLHLNDQFCRFFYPSFTYNDCRSHTAAFLEIMEIRWEVFFIDHGLTKYWANGELTEAGQTIINEIRTKKQEENKSSFKFKFKFRGQEDDILLNAERNMEYILLNHDRFKPKDDVIQSSLSRAHEQYGNVSKHATDTNFDYYFEEERSKIIQKTKDEQQKRFSLARKKLEEKLEKFIIAEPMLYTKKIPISGKIPGNLHCLKRSNQQLYTRKIIRR